MIKINHKLTDRRNVVLSEGDDSYILFRSTIEECDKIKEIIEIAGTSKNSKEYTVANAMSIELLGYNINEVLAYGTGGLDRFTKIKTIESITIPYGPGDVIKDAIRQPKSYKCFQGFDWKAPHNKLIYHEDAASAWNCAMETLGNPEALILIRTKVMKHL